MHLSLIIPAYNEEDRIGQTLTIVLAYLERQAYASEVIVVDDGSTDATSKKVAEFPSVKLMISRPNRGKGHAVRTGMLAGTGAFRVYYDADASTPIEELEKLWPVFHAGADIVIGSRSLPGSRVELRQAWYRETMGRAFNLLLRVAGLTHFPDTQCGFKGFTAKACEAVFPRQTINRYSFDAEILYIAEHRGLRIEQVPVRWVNSPHSRLNAISDSARMLWDMLRIRWQAFRGLYD